MKNKYLLKNVVLFRKKSQLLVSNGRITSFKPEQAIDNVIDGNGLFLFPGLIDVHTHIRDMELSQKETWLSASMAAAAGGITTIFDMPNTKPATYDQKSLDIKRKAAEKSIVNYNFNFGVTDYNHEQARNSRPIAALKMFMAESSSGYVVEKDEEVRKVFKLASEIDKPLIVHSELQSCVEKHEKQYPPVISNHDKIRNRKCTIKATELLLNILKDIPVKLYIAHVSTAEEIDLIRQAKNDGLNVYCEITPHHLFINETILEKCANFGKVNPPLRTQKDNEALLEAIVDGTADTIGTDHAPHTKDEKSNDYQFAPSGFPGLETSFGLMLQLVQKKLISYERLAELMAGNPAKIFNIKDRGKLDINSFADLILFDPEFKWIVNPDHFYTKAKYSPFEKFNLKGKVIKTFVNGNLVFDSDIFNTDFKGMEVEFS